LSRPVLRALSNDRQVPRCPLRTRMVISPEIFPRLDVRHRRAGCPGPPPSTDPVTRLRVHFARVRVPRGRSRHWTRPQLPRCRHNRAPRSGSEHHFGPAKGFPAMPKRFHPPQKSHAMSAIRIGCKLRGGHEPGVPARAPPPGSPPITNRGPETSAVRRAGPNADHQTAWSIPWPGPHVRRDQPFIPGLLEST